jgi:D-glycero-D-manno-heptose 1,7-bisphosphate phosphatase
MKGRALFLDRDGVVNVEVGYLHRIEDVQFVPGIVSLCRTAMQLRYRLVVVTNQAGIARGYYTEDDFLTLMEWMRAELRKDGVEFDAVYHCPYHPDHGVGQYRREHEDRKPGIGMLQRAVKEFGVDLSRSVLVGDRCSDIGAANKAGLKQAFLMVGTEEGTCTGEYRSVQSLAEVEDWLTSQG